MGVKERLNEYIKSQGLSVLALPEPLEGVTASGVMYTVSIISLVVAIVFVALLAWYLVRFLEEIHNVSDAFNNIADAIRHEEHEQDEFESKVKDFIETFAPKN